MGSLPLEDVIFKYILPRLEPHDWISLLSTSKLMNGITSSFLFGNKTMSIASLSTITMISFKILTEDALNLRILSLSGCSWMTDQLLMPVLKNNSRLNCIDLSQCNGCTEGILQILTVQCPYITHLVLRQCKWVVPDALDYMSYHHSLKSQNTNIEAVLSFMGRGLRTNVSTREKSKYRGKEWFYHNLQVKPLKPKIKTQLSKMHPHLLKADLRGCEKIQDINIDKFVKVFDHLEILKIGNNPNITDSSLKSVALNLQNLHTLDISCCHKISKAGLFTVVKYCTKLRSVEIGNTQFPKGLLSLMESRKISVKQTCLKREICSVETTNTFTSNNAEIVQ